MDMTKGYWIARVDISDPEKYKAYVEANGPVFAKCGARFIVRAGRSETVEGTSRSRNIVLEFPSYEAAVACWHSAEYQDLRPLRTAVSVADVLIIEGYDGPQPEARHIPEPA